MTAISLSSFKVQAQNLVPNISSDELTTLNINQQIKQAVRDYSNLAPDEVTIDVSGDGGRYYPITNLTRWSDEFSRIVTIQFPAPTVSSDEEPVYLEPEDWDDKYFDGSTQYIFLPNHSPGAADAFRVMYLAPYSWVSTGGDTESVQRVAHGLSLNDPVYENTDSKWTETESLDLLATHKVTTVTDVDNFIVTELTVDIPPQDFFVICLRTACLICREIAARYSRTSDSTILVDSVNHPSRAEEFEKRAEKLCKEFTEQMGIRTGEDGSLMPPASGDFVDWDNAPGWPTGRRYLFHNEDTR